MEKKSYIIFIIFILLLIFGGSVYIDYYIAKSRNTAPRIAYKKELDGGITSYTGVMYKMWYCKDTKTYTIGGYRDPKPVCTLVRKFDKQENYVNGAGITISKKDIALLSELYNDNIIETINSEKSLENAKYVSSLYRKINHYKEVEEEVKETVTNITSKNKKTTSKTVSTKTRMIVFEELAKSKDGNYEWEYNEKVKYCFKEENDKKYYATYKNETCGEYIELTYDEKWCSLYEENSKLAYDEKIKRICKEKVNETESN